MVEVIHGNGYVTRYAHNAQNLVAVGDHVEQGQTIALMGSTGRATGPNLHFEVWYQGRPVNPARFVQHPPVTGGQPASPTGCWQRLGARTSPALRCRVSHRHAA